jgi:hypothetical protein
VVHVGAPEVGSDGMAPEDRALLRRVFEGDLALFQSLSGLEFNP